MLTFILATAFITAITVSVAVANRIVRRHAAETRQQTGMAEYSVKMF
ncbi:hypothetical protein AB0O87_01420 [Microbacterium sp. NPDC076768]